MDRRAEILYHHIDLMKETYIKRLKEFVAIPSISEDLNHRLDVLRALRWCGIRLKNMGFDIRYRIVGTENVYIGDEVPLRTEETAHLPYLLCASLGYDTTKYTLLIYGHVDVKMIAPGEVWNGDPFEMQVVGDFIYGRGVTDDKGPVLGWINAIETFTQCAIELPVNVRFLIDGSEETGSELIPELLRELRKDFLVGVDFVAISDNYWLNMDTPCLTYGLRGVIYFYVYVDGSSRVLHSGTHGGAVQNPLVDLEALMCSLVSTNGTILVPGAYSCVRRPTEAELRNFETLDFDPATYAKQIGTDALYSNDKVELLRRRWLLPAVEFHGIEKSFDRIGAPTLIPKSVMGKFSLRIVPDQNPYLMSERFKCYLHQMHYRRCSGNRLRVKSFIDGRAFLADHTCVNYRAAYKALEEVWKKKPDLTRDGATIAMACTLEETTNRDVVLIPMGECQDFQHEARERMSVRNYINGIKVFVSYLCNLSAAIIEDSEDEDMRQEDRDRWRKRFW
uniref:M20_dimer domain-containing protein n=1 Tax=Mesocestoides corti TaxID=53468 RepID=A0A5K3F8F8_MESCO